MTISLENCVTGKAFIVKNIFVIFSIVFYFLRFWTFGGNFKSFWTFF